MFVINSDKSWQFAAVYQSCEIYCWENILLWFLRELLRAVFNVLQNIEIWCKSSRWPSALQNLCWQVHNELHLENSLWLKVSNKCRIEFWQFYLVALFGRKLQFFKNLSDYSNVNVAHFARYVKWDFFCDFQTLCAISWDLLRQIHWLDDNSVVCTIN